MPLPLSASFQVQIVGDHDDLYPHWEALKLRQAVLVHFDEHPDFDWMTLPGSQTHAPSFLSRKRHVGNFLCQAFRDGMFRKWFWIVPEAVWQSRGMRIFLRDTVQSWYRNREGDMTRPEIGPTYIAARIENTDAWIGPQSLLQGIAGPVILSVDTDYFTALETTQYPCPARMRRRNPWLWPDEWAALIRQSSMEIQHAGISLSVDGGFNPSAFKFFGKALELFLTNQETSPQAQEYFLLKQAIQARANGRDSDAAGILDRFSSAGEMEAARCLQKAYILGDQGRWAEAQTFARKALQADPDLDTPFLSQGSVYEGAGCYRDAEKEYAYFAGLFPGNRACLKGLARAAFYQKQNSRARKLFQEAFEREPEDPETLRYRGELCLRSQELPEAERAFRQSLSFQPGEPRTHTGLGEALLRQGKWEEARLSLRESLRLGWYSRDNYFLLAKLYARMRKWAKCRECCWEVFRLQREYFRLQIHFFIYRIQDFLSRQAG